MENESVGSESSESSGSDASSAVSFSQTAECRPYSTDANIVVAKSILRQEKAVATKSSRATATSHGASVDVRASQLTLHPAEIAALKKQHKNMGVLSRGRVDAEVEYQWDLNIERIAAQEKEICDLKTAIGEMTSMMKWLVESQAGTSTASALALVPTTPNVGLDDDPDFQVVSPPRGNRKSTLMRAVAVAHSPPPLHSQAVKNAKKSKISVHEEKNRFSSLARALDESETETEDAAFVGDIEPMEVDDTSETEARIKNLSLLQSKPSAVHKKDGAGRKE